jgi:hypothetical protein
MTGGNATTKQDEAECTTFDVHIRWACWGAVIAMGHQNAQEHQLRRVQATVGTMIGREEMHEQGLLVNSTEDVLTVITGDGVTVSGYQAV